MAKVAPQRVRSIDVVGGGIVTAMGIEVINALVLGDAGSVGCPAIDQGHGPGLLRQGNHVFVEPGDMILMPVAGVSPDNIGGLPRIIVNVDGGIIRRGWGDSMGQNRLAQSILVGASWAIRADGHAQATLAL